MRGFVTAIGGLVLLTAVHREAGFVSDFCESHEVSMLTALNIMFRTISVVYSPEILGFISVYSSQSILKMRLDDGCTPRAPALRF